VGWADYIIGVSSLTAKLNSSLVHKGAIISPTADVVFVHDNSLLDGRQVKPYVVPRAMKPWRATAEATSDTASNWAAVEHVAPAVDAGVGHVFVKILSSVRVWGLKLSSSGGVVADDGAGSVNYVDYQVDMEADQVAKLQRFPMLYVEPPVFTSLAIDGQGNITLTAKENGARPLGQVGIHFVLEGKDAETRRIMSDIGDGLGDEVTKFTGEFEPSLTFADQVVASYALENLAIFRQSVNAGYTTVGHSDPMFYPFSQTAFHEFSVADIESNNPGSVVFYTVPSEVSPTVFKYIYTNEATGVSSQRIKVRFYGSHLIGEVDYLNAGYDELGVMSLLVDDTPTAPELQATTKKHALNTRRKKLTLKYGPGHVFEGMGSVDSSWLFSFAMIHMKKSSTGDELMVGGHGRTQSENVFILNSQYAPDEAEV
jgi:hypothetical protein